MDCKYELACSNEILFEYEEQLKIRYDIPSVEEILANLIENRNIQLYDPEFNWNLIQQDPDDNKFVDCAIAANVDFIVTNDNHFNILRNIPFPKVKTIRLQEFVELLCNREC